MGFAEDRVKEYIIRNCHEFHNVRLNQLLDYLPCLTTTDRQTISARLRNEGNNLTTFEFIECLSCRRGWVTDLISALERNNSDLAEVIRRVYEAAQPPPQRASAARPVQAAVPHSRPAASLPVGPSAPSSDDAPLSLPCNQPTRAPLSTGVNPLAPAPLAPRQDVVDYRSPVQETKCASSLSSEMAIDAKVSEDAKQKILTPDQRNRNVVESDPSTAVQHENLTDAQAEFPRSPVEHQTPLREVSDEMQSATRVASRPDTGNLVQNWDGFQPRPVCVKNGYFGSVGRSVDGGMSPAPELATSSALTAFGNQPEENSYLSSDSSPLPPRSQDRMQAEERKVQPSRGCQGGDLLDNPAVNKPILQMQVDEEQKGAQRQRDSTSKANAVPLLQNKADRHSRLVNSSRADFRAGPSGANPTSSTPVDLQRRSTAPPPSVPSEARTSFDQYSSSVGSEEVSFDHALCYEATPGSNQLSEGRTLDRETRGPFVPKAFQEDSSLGQSPSKISPFSQRPSRKETVSRIPSTIPDGRFRSPPSSVAGFSSTDVIPPSSLAAVLGPLSDVQERELEEGDLWITPQKTPRDVPSRPPVVQPSYLADNPANSRGNKNNASGRPRDARVFHSNPEEEDISLLKPGVLVAEKTTGEPLSEQSELYSVTSDRFRFSGDSSQISDPLMLSDSTQGSRREDPGRNAGTTTSHASLCHRDDDHSDGGSIRTHTGHIEEPPSVDLTGAPEVIWPALRNASQPPGDFVDSVSRDPPVRNASSRPVCDDGRGNSPQDERAADPASFLPSDSTLLAVGFALASLMAVAFVLYKQLKK